MSASVSVPGRRRATLLWVALIATVASPVALNAVNLYRLSVDRLGLSGAAALALPVTLDGAALVALIIRLRGIRDGDSAPGASLAVAGFAGLSAYLAGVEGHAVGGPIGALALGVLPIVAVVMLDLAVSSIRRDDLRAAGLLPGRAPVYSGLRWVLAPRSTATAWRHGVLWENPDRRACLTATSTATGNATATRATRATGTGTAPPTATGPAPDMSPPVVAAGPVPGAGAARQPQVPGAPEAAPASWAGSKRDLVRSLTAVGVLDRAGIVAECARHGVAVSGREVTRLLAEHRNPQPAAVTPIRSRRDAR